MDATEDECRRIAANYARDQAAFNAADQDWRPLVDNIKNNLEPRERELSQVVRILEVADTLNGIPTGSRAISLVQDVGEILLAPALGHYRLQLEEARRALNAARNDAAHFAEVRKTHRDNLLLSESQWRNGRCDRYSL